VSCERLVNGSPGGLGHMTSIIGAESNGELVWMSSITARRLGGKTSWGQRPPLDKLAFR
jgi:hypothetical protein